MELHLKQWRDQQHESEQQVSAAKIPKLFLEPHEAQHLHQHQQPMSSGSSALPLFVPEPTSKVSSLSAFSDSTSRFPRMGSYFSLAQWQELELQALIYRYMLAGAVVPPELLQPIKKSLVNSSPYFLHHPLQHYSHFQPASLQSGYWGRGAMDPEPGRCRRTDGKKWRCSRDVVAGHKYCERHMHRGRNRSRKHVEIPTPTSAAAGTTLKTTSSTVNNNNNISAATVAAPSPFAQMANATTFALSAPSPSIDLLQFNQSSCVSKAVSKGLFEPQNEVGNSSDGHILRPFFDDWPRSFHDHNNCESNSSTVNSATCLSISMPGNSSSSDVSLKLSTGNIDEPGSQGGGREEPQLNWAAGWATHTVASMGGPLAEALRSSTSNSNSSPTSVLHQLPRSSASEASYVST